MSAPRPPHIVLLAGDITAVRVDAVVNAAKRSLLGGGGVDGAIHRAGGPEILRECRALRAHRFPDGLPTGQAVATEAGDLPAQWVIHTVGPVHGQQGGELLADCYRNSLAVADSLGARTVAFPLISAGAYGWPREDAIRTAIDTLRGATTSVDTATLVLFDADTLRLAEQILG